MTAMQPSQSYMPLTVNREASSHHVITSFVIGSQPFPGMPFCPRTCATKLSYTQIVYCKYQTISRQDTNPPHHHIQKRPRKIRKNLWSVISEKKGQTVFTTCVLWTLAQNTMWRCHQRGVFKMQQRKKNIYLEACLQQRRVFFALSYLHWWVTGCGGGLPWKVQLSASQQSVTSPTQGHVDTSISGLQSLWCGQHTRASGGPGYAHNGLECNTHSGITTQY